MTAIKKASKIEVLNKVMLMSFALVLAWLVSMTLSICTYIIAWS